MPQKYIDDIAVINSAINMLMQFGRIEKAEEIFSKMKQRNSYTYGVMIKGYNLNEKPHQSLALLDRMKREKILVNEAIAMLLIGACSQIGIRSICQNIVHQISHLPENLQVKTALIDMWVGHLQLVRSLFQSLPFFSYIG